MKIAQLITPRTFSALLGISFIAAVIFVAALFAVGHIRSDTVTDIGPLRLSFCVDGNQTAHYTNGRFVTFPDKSSSSFQIDTSEFLGNSCSVDPTGDTQIFTANSVELPDNIAAGNLACLWNTNPLPTTDCRSDTTPPTISSLTAGSITQTGATITWTTNESATHTVKYGTTSGSYDSYPNSKSAGSGTSASAAL